MIDISTIYKQKSSQYNNRDVWNYNHLTYLSRGHDVHMEVLHNLDSLFYEQAVYILMLLISRKHIKPTSSHLHLPPSVQTPPAANYDLLRIF